MSSDEFLFVVPADDDDGDGDDAVNSTLSLSESSRAALFAVSPKRESSVFWHFADAVKNNARLRFWCAPMVAGSELAFRLLVRERGCGVATTPMLPSNGFAANEQLRDLVFDALPNSDADRPLIVQFSANDPLTLLRAARCVEAQCDAVEINVGCPQHCAKRGNFGAFLLDDVELVCDMVRICARHLSVPILVKTRIFAEYAPTLAFATAIADAGASVLTVHARTRAQKRSAEHLADWSVIRRLVDDLGHRIPIVANGNVRCRADAEQCLRQTGAVAVMSACSLLTNPALFDETESESDNVLAHGVSRNYANIDKALRYLELVAQHGAPGQNVSRHMHDMLPPSVFRASPSFASTVDQIVHMKGVPRELAQQLHADLMIAKDQCLPSR